MLVHPQFDPVRVVSSGPVPVHWYGLTYLVAFGLFLWLARARARASRSSPARGWTRRDVEDLLFFGVLGVVIGGRLGYVLFYKPGYYAAHPLEVFVVWKGGMSFHGGLLGVIAAMALFARRRGRSFSGDRPRRAVRAGRPGAGRIGNFINGELWGRAADPSCRGRWCFRSRAPTCRAIRRSCTSLRSKACCCSCCCGCMRASRGGSGRCRARSSSATACCASSPSTSASPTASSACWRSNMSMGQWLCVPMVVAGSR